MFSNRQEILDAIDARQDVEFIYFYGHTGDKPKRCLSNFAPTPFKSDWLICEGDDATIKDLEEMSRYFPTSEHWYMCGKALTFGDWDAYDRISLTDSPFEAKAIGRQVTDFNQERWLQVAEDIMYHGCLQKFQQNKWCHDYLVGTGDAVLVEAAPRDTIWGVGLSIEQCLETNDPMDWRGKNLLGFTLMRVREKLLQDANDK